GALPLASLAAETKVHHVVERAARQGIESKLAGHREAKGVGAPARRVLFVARRHVTGAHRSGVRLAAMADSGAILDGLIESAILAVEVLRREGEPPILNSHPKIFL